MMNDGVLSDRGRTTVDTRVKGGGVALTNSHLKTIKAQHNEDSQWCDGSHEVEGVRLGMRQ